MTTDFDESLRLDMLSARNNTIENKLKEDIQKLKNLIR